jgi:hypothetical protein
MNPALIGYWTIPATYGGDDEIFHISDAGLYVRLVTVSVDPLTRQAMKLWLKGIEGNRLKVWSSQGRSKAWEVTMSTSNDELLIDRSNLQFRCKRIIKEDVPDWFEVALHKAHDSMKKQEADPVE